MANLTFSLGGRLDPSYRATLNQSVTEAKMAGLQIQTSLRTAITEQESKLAQLAKRNAMPAGFIGPRPMNEEEIGRTAYVEEQKLKLRLMGSTQATAIERMRVASAAKADAEQVELNQAAMAQIMASEKAAGIVYENDKAAQLAAEDILEQQRAAEAVKTDAEKVASNRAAMASILAEEREKAAAEEALMDIELTARAKTEAAKVAAVKASQLAMLTTIAEKGTVMEALGHGGGPGGGVSGIMREMLVIVREFGRGNWTRIPGSITLLAQYTGVLKKLISSTAAETVMAASAEDKLAASMARTALQAEAKAAVSAKAAGMTTVNTELELAQAEASNLAAIAQTKKAAAQEMAATTGAQSAAASTAQAEADIAEAAAARASAIAQAQKAEAASTAAKIQTAVATIKPSGLGIVVAILVVLAAAAYFTWRHIKNLNEELDRTGKEYAKGAGDYTKAFGQAMYEAAKQAADFNDWLKRLGTTYDDLGKKTQDEIELLREQFSLMRGLAQISGISKSEERETEQKERGQELEDLQTAQAQAKLDADAAKAEAIRSESQINFDPNKQKRIVELEQKPGGTRTDAEKHELEDLIRQMQANPAISRQAQLTDVNQRITDTTKSLEENKKIQEELQKKVDAANQNSENVIHASARDNPYLQAGQIQSQVEAARRKNAAELMSVGSKGNEKRISLDQINATIKSQTDELNPMTPGSLPMRRSVLESENESLKREAEEAKTDAQKKADILKSIGDQIKTLVKTINLHNYFDPLYAQAEAMVQEEKDFEESLTGMKKQDRAGAIKRRIAELESQASFDTYMATLPGGQASFYKAQQETTEAESLKKKLTRDQVDDVRNRGMQLDMPDWNTIGASLGGHQAAILDTAKAQSMDVKAIRHMLEKFKFASPTTGKNPWGGFR